MRRSYVISLVTICVLAFGGLAFVLAAGWQPALGLDLQGGASVVLQPEGEYDDDALDQSVEIIRNRVDGLGVAEPEVVRQGDAIVVSLPGVENQDEALRIVGQTAELQFRPVLADVPAALLPPDGLTSSTTAPGTTSADSPTTAPGTTAPAATTSVTTTAPATPNPGESRLGRQTGTTTTTATTVPSTGQTELPTCANAAEFAIPDEQVILPECDDDREVVTYYELGPVFLTGAGVETAEARFDPQTGWTVSLTLKPGEEGIDTFNVWAEKCYNGDPECPSDGASRGRVAIVLDGIVQSAPQINAPSFERDQIVISGDFTQSEAEDLALVLRYGALPVELEPQAVQTVSPTLGEDSLQAAVISGVVGVLLVVGLLFLYYRRLTVVVLAGLLVSAAIVWTVVAILSETRGLALTLAGVTGIIVSVGVTVDSYVVYFERLKDDVRSGKTIRSSAERGFKGAWRTILAADVVSLIGAGLLWWLTVGSVRGFAFFLGLSTIVDMIVAYFFTRPAVGLLARSRFMAGERVLGVVPGEAVPVSGGAK
jgi:preprotein translocase subunit SecD